MRSCRFGRMGLSLMVFVWSSPVPSATHSIGYLCATRDDRCKCLSIIHSWPSSFGTRGRWWDQWLDFLPPFITHFPEPLTCHCLSSRFEFLSSEVHGAAHKTHLLYELVGKISRGIPNRIGGRDVGVHQHHIHPMIGMI